MRKKKSKKIELANCNSIRFPVIDKIEHDMLIVGNFDGIFGNFITTPTGKLDFNASAKDALMVNGKAIIKTIQNKKHVYLLSTEETAKYFMEFLTICRDKGFFNSVGRSSAINKYFHYSIIDLEKDDNEIIDCVNNRLFNNLDNMKFDYIIQNPPYNGSLHLDFLAKGLDLLSNKGRMVIIEPATWLINIRKSGSSAKESNAIKDRLEGHVESIVIENRNNDFGTTQHVPFATAVIDMTKTYDEIELTCCGEKRKVKSLYDCNLIGDYATIWSILEKVRSFGDMMKSHTTQKNMGSDFWYTKYGKTVGGAGGSLCAATTERVGCSYDSESLWKETAYGKYCTPFTSVAYHYYKNSIEPKPLCSYDKGKHLTENIADNLYGTKEELENWKHFIFNNKLPLFINLAMTFHQQNVVTGWLPWLVDKQYTDEEINEMFGFTNEEIALIDRTIKKYERNSPWFKRYMCGPDSVSDEEVNNFINNL